MRLWVHEMNRVFRDRLLDKKDTGDFDSLLRKSVTFKLKLREEELFKDEFNLFGDFMDRDSDTKI